MEYLYCLSLSLSLSTEGSCNSSRRPPTVGAGAPISAELKLSEEGLQLASGI